ncbi:alginate lyase family protein [Dyadobacter sp. UC 10]|nr:alginate lyase family protein [Dyadobacter sp. UC 10]
MHPKSQLDYVKKQIKTRQQPHWDAYQQLIVYADSALQKPAEALADFSVPGYYVNALMHRKNSKSLMSNAFGAYACALAWQLSGEQKYADKSLEILNAWGSTNTKYSDADGSLVMSYAGSGMLMAAELLYHYEGWEKADKKQFGTWVENVYKKACNEIRNRSNNWADWGRLGSALCAQFLDDEKEMAENAKLIKSDLFHKIAADGSMPEETKRKANGIWYTYFSLAPITAASWVIFNATGENLFTYSQEGRSMKTALDYLHYYAMNPSEWKWFENPNKGSAGSWPGNLLEAMSGIYKENEYVKYVQAKRPLIYPTHHFAWTFPTLMTVTLDQSKQEKP